MSRCITDRLQRVENCATNEVAVLFLYLLIGVVFVSSFSVISPWNFKMIVLCDHVLCIKCTIELEGAFTPRNLQPGKLCYVSGGSFV